MGRKAKRRPSAADVARLAGVSSQTVSRVSNDSPKVLPSTRNKVLNAMDELGYSPNLAARALRVGRFGSLGLVTQNVSTTGEANLLHAVAHAARAKGFSINLLDVHSAGDRSFERAVYLLNSQSVDGIMIIRTEKDAAQTLSLPQSVPVVVLYDALVGKYPSVTADEAGGVRAAVEYLLDLGHLTVHHVAGPKQSVPADIRLRAWKETLVSNGREVTVPWRGDWSLESGRRLAREVVANADVTAVLTANDEMAIGLIRGLHEMGVSVPQDISIVGFDGLPVGAYLTPPLTTVRQNFKGVGATLVATLCELIDDPSTQVPDCQLIPVSLNIRESAAAPRRT